MSFRIQASVDRRLMALAAEQHAVFALHTLRGLGLSESAVRSRVTAGRLFRRFRGVYSLIPNELLTRNGRYMAAVLACGPGAVLSHRAAAHLLDLAPYQGTKLEVTVPTRSPRRHAGLTVYRSTTLTAADVTQVENIPCTSVARTLFDLTEVVDRRRAERAFDRADMHQALDVRAIDDQVARNATRPGAKKVKALLDEYYIGGGMTESELEEAFLQLARAVGLPRPEVNAWIMLDDGEPPIRADFVWRAERIVVETDGRRVHGTHQAHQRDPRRDQRLMVAGWWSVRTTWRQIKFRPRELEATVRALLRQARQDQPPPRAATG